MCIGHCCWLAVAVLTNSQSEDCDDKGIRYRTYRMMVVVLVFRQEIGAKTQSCLLLKLLSRYQGSRTAETY